MKVLVLGNNELKEKEIDNELKTLQEIVGGYIEMPVLSKVFYNSKVDVIINEEGKFIDGLKPEIAIVKSGTNQILDVIYGNCIFASHNEECETIALNEEQIELVKKELEVEAMLGDGGLVKVLFI